MLAATLLLTSKGSMQSQLGQVLRLLVSWFRAYFAAAVPAALHLISTGPAPDAEALDRL